MKKNVIFVLSGMFAAVAFGYYTMAKYFRSKKAKAELADNEND